MHEVELYVPSNNVDLNGIEESFLHGRKTQVSDKLSETLAAHAATLDVSLRHLESAKRIQLFEGIVNLRDSRDELARVLFEFHQLYKAKRVWTLVAEAIGDELGQSGRTIDRLVRRHMERLGMKPPTKARLKRKKPYKQEIENSKALFRSSLTDEQERFFELRTHLRNCLNDASSDSRIRIIKNAIEVEAYESWGMYQVIPMVIEPRASTVFIEDGLSSFLGSDLEDQTAFVDTESQVN